MVLNQLKKVISFAMALAVVLSLSCCGVGDEALIDEIDTETTSEATETTSEETTEELTTLETTTEETEETTTDETEEATTEETKELTPEEIAILETLTDEEKEVWLTMPDIVTMRMLERFDDDKNEILYTEIVYIDKMGQIKKFITYDDLASPYDDITIAWLNDQIDQNKDAEIIDIADIHTLIEFYNTFMRIDKNSKLHLAYRILPEEYIERHYQFNLYGTRNDGKNNFETLEISSRHAGNPYVRYNNADDVETIDESGWETLNLYLKLDPFMVLIDGGYGHLTGEEV